MLSAVGLEGLMSVVIDYGATARHKPRPDPLLEACRQFRVRPEATWYVGDDPADALAAQEAQMPFAWASWGYGVAAPTGTNMTLDFPHALRLLGGDVHP